MSLKSYSQDYDTVNHWVAPLGNMVLVDTSIKVDHTFQNEIIAESQSISSPVRVKSYGVIMVILRKEKPNTEHKTNCLPTYTICFVNIIFPDYIISTTSIAILAYDLLD